MDHYSEMVIFVAVAEELGLAAAARRLQQSAPTITRAIAGLERRLAIRLLDRNTRGVRLTEAGARYLADCKRILQELAEAEASVAGLHTSVAGSMTLAAPLLLGQDRLTPILMTYLDEHPAVSARAIFMDRMPNLHEEGIDIALSIGELPDSSLIALKVGAVRRVVCASPNYLKRCGIPRHPEELPSHQLIASLADTPANEWQFGALDDFIKVQIAPRLTTSTNTAAIAAAVGGAGLTRVLSYQIVDYLRAGQLQLVLENYEPAAMPVHLLYREGRRAAARVRSFVDYAVQRLRAASY